MGESCLEFRKAALPDTPVCSEQDVHDLSTVSESEAEQLVGWCVDVLVQ